MATDLRYETLKAAAKGKKTGSKQHLAVLDYEAECFGDESSAAFAATLRENARVARREAARISREAKASAAKMAEVQALLDACRVVSGAR